MATSTLAPVTSSRPDVDHRALHDPLETGRGFGVIAVIDHQRCELGVEIVDQALFQRRHIDVAGAHDRGGVGVVEQGQQQVLQRREFVLSLIGVGHRAVDRFFQVT
jgi:hypothetical protein